MKLRNLISASLTALIALSSCTHHNGDIGPYFGSWHLDRITIDGADDTEYDGDIFWKFQSDIICMTVVDDFTHSRNEYWGTWSESDGTLTLNYSYSDDITNAGTGRYAPAPATHLPSGMTSLSIDSAPGSSMQLTYDSPDGESYSYYLTKW